MSARKFRPQRIGVARKNCGCGCGGKGDCGGVRTNSGSLPFEQARQVQDLVTTWVWGRTGVVDVDLMQLPRRQWAVRVKYNAPSAVQGIPAVVSGVPVYCVPV